MEATRGTFDPPSCWGGYGKLLQLPGASVESPCPPTNRELYAMVMDLKATNRELYATVMDLKAGLKENKLELKEFKDLGREWSRNDLIVCAAEILKWSVKLRGEKDGDGRQFFRDDLFPLVAVSIPFSVHASV
jgi:hypothetical protein